MKRRILIALLVLIIICSVLIVVLNNVYTLESELSDVHREIGVNSFNYANNKEITKINKVRGFEISIDDFKEVYLPNQADKEYEIEFETDEDSKGQVREKSCFKKYVDNELEWSVDFDDFIIEDYVMFMESVVIYGRTPIYSSGEKSSIKIALLDEAGEMIWEINPDNGFKSEYIGAVLPGDNEIIVFTRGDLEYLCFNRIDTTGNITDFNKVLIGNFGVWNAAVLEDGYVVQLGSYVEEEHARIVITDEEGFITRSDIYFSDNEYYYITDLIEFNKSIYLSGYSVAKLSDESRSAGGRYDIAAVLNYIFDNNLLNISSEELTELVKDNFTAVLLVCNIDSGDPVEFYTADHSLGGKLSMEDSGELVWEIETIEDTFFSPMTSSFTIGGESDLNKIVFSSKGSVLRFEKTKETKNFRR